MPTARVLKFDAIVGADGAFSAVRHAMQFTDRFDFSQDYIDHGYKELQIPAGECGNIQAGEKRFTHMAPAKVLCSSPFQTRTAVLLVLYFFPLTEKLSFNSLQSDEAIHRFFEENFPDAMSLMPELINDFKTNATSSLVTMKCYPWVRAKTVINRRRRTCSRSFLRAGNEFRF